MDRHDGELQYFAENVLPSIVDGKLREKQKRISIRLTGASTGEEAASVYYYIRQEFEKPSNREKWGSIDEWEIEILCMDVSEHAISEARRKLLDRPGAMESNPDRPASSRQVREAINETPRERRAQIFRFKHGSIACEPNRQEFLEGADAVFANVCLHHVITDARAEVVEDFLNSPAWILTTHSCIYEAAAGRREAAETPGETAMNTLAYAVAPQGETLVQPQIAATRKIEDYTESDIRRLLDELGELLPTNTFYNTDRPRSDYDRAGHMEALVQALGERRVQLMPSTIAVLTGIARRTDVADEYRQYAQRLLAVHETVKTESALQLGTEEARDRYAGDIVATAGKLYEGRLLNKEAPKEERNRYIIMTRNAVPARQWTRAQTRLRRFLRERRATNLILVEDISEMDDKLAGLGCTREKAVLVATPDELEGIAQKPEHRGNEFRSVAVSGEDAAPVPLVGVAAYADTLLDLNATNADTLVPLLEEQFVSIVGGQGEIDRNPRLQGMQEAFRDHPGFVRQLDEDPIGFARRIQLLLPPVDRANFDDIFDKLRNREDEFFEKHA